MKGEGIMIRSILRFLCSDKKRFSLKVDGHHLKASLEQGDAEGWRDQLRERFPKLGVEVVKARRGMRR